MKKALVTGANGFIGKNLVEKMLQDNHYDLILADKTGDEKIFSRPEKLKFILQDQKPEIIFHLGAISSTTEQNVYEIAKNNMLLSCQLLEYANNTDASLVYASSASVYGLGKNGFQEDSQLQPLNYYAMSKAYFDKIVEQKIKDNKSIKVVGLRYFNVYGKYEEHKKDMASPVHKFITQSSKSNCIKIFKGSHNFYRDFVHVDDIVSITKSAISFESGIYNAGTGIPRSFYDIAKFLSKKTNSDIKEIDFPTKLVGKYQMYTCSDNKKINSQYFQNRISLEEGIERVLQ